MCLVKITKITHKQGFGWKCFDVNLDGKLVFMYRKEVAISEIEKLNSGRWIRANNTFILTDREEKYKSGFHLFLSKVSANKYRMRNTRSINKIEYRNVVAEGTSSPGNHLKTVVAKEIRLVKKET